MSLTLFKKELFYKTYANLKRTVQFIIQRYELINLQISNMYLIGPGGILIIIPVQYIILYINTISLSISYSKYCKV